MLKVLEKKKEISAAQQQLKQAMAQYLGGGARTRKIGHQGGQVPAPTYTDGKRWFASTTVRRDARSTRHWNAIGLDYRGPPNTEIITVEINFPLQGYNGRIAGAFAKDEHEPGRIYLLHDGNVGGGRKGIGKHAFLEWLPVDRVEALHASGKSRAFIPIGALDDSTLPENIFWFVEQVHEFKEQVTRGRPGTASFNPNAPRAGYYVPEFSGRRRKVTGSAYAAYCEHGKIVDALKSHLERHIIPGERLVNDRHVDLGIEKGRQWRAIFEVKTGADRQSIYTALGQLLIYSKASRKISKVMVLPHVDDNFRSFRPILAEMGVWLIPCKRTRGGYAFPGLERFLSNQLR